MVMLCFPSGYFSARGAPLELHGELERQTDRQASRQTCTHTLASALRNSAAQHLPAAGCEYGVGSVFTMKWDQ